VIRPIQSNRAPPQPATPDGPPATSARETQEDHHQPKPTTTDAGIPVESDDHSLHDRLPDVSTEQRAETAATVHRVLRKVLHRPTVRAKEFAAGPHGPVYLDALRQLFDLSTGEAGHDRIHRARRLRSELLRGDPPTALAC
jgi:hypothetical protein